MMAKAWNQTRVSEVLGIEYPIIQGPLGGLSSQRLTAAVSNFGGLGSLGAHGLEPNAIEDVIAEIRSMTAKPFAMNLWVSMEDAGARTSDAEKFRQALSHLSPHVEALGGTQPEFAPYKPIRFEDQARVLLDANVPAFSFIYGIPRKEILDEARKRGIVTLGTATTPDEAIALEHAGVEMVVASGFEAGGHRGSFCEGSGYEHGQTSCHTPDRMRRCDKPAPPSEVPRPSGEDRSALLQNGSVAASLCHQEPPSYLLLTRPQTRWKESPNVRKSPFN
jgi:nitronate monooxygenase